MATRAEPTIDESRFKVEFLRPEDFEAVHRLQVDCFTLQNTETSRTRVSKWAWGEFSRWLNNGWEKADLTQIVRDRHADDAVVAFLFCKELDFSELVREPLPKNFKAICRDSPGLGRVVEHGMQKLKDPFMVPRVGPILHVETGGTMTGYEGLGIAKYLRWRLCRLAADRGFMGIMVETTSMATRHIWSELVGLDVLMESRYVDWQSKDGKRPFRDEFPMPEDMVLTCQYKALLPALGSLNAPRLRISGGAAEEANGTYVLVPGSRGVMGTTHEAWVHTERPGCFVSYWDGPDCGGRWLLRYLAQTALSICFGCSGGRRMVRGRKWLLFYPQGVCYAKIVEADQENQHKDSPPQGQWEAVSWLARLGIGKPGAAPTPKVEILQKAVRKPLHNIGGA